MTGIPRKADGSAAELIKSHAERTRIPGAASGPGDFAGVFAPDISKLREPAIVSTAGGVGAKLKIAFDMDKHDAVGIDCVAACVNDIICAGASPLFFLYRLAMGKDAPKLAERIISGVADGCEMAGCALIGGDAGETPGFYEDGEYDLAGFSAGVADKGKIFDPGGVRDGDAIIGISSSGVHLSGFSLVRRVFSTDRRGAREYIGELGSTLGEALLIPTRVYVKPVLALMDAVRVKSACHITGGGLYESIPRALPEGLGARIERGAINTPAIFGLIQKTGRIPERDMFGTFNMGVGMCVIVTAEDAATAVRFLQHRGEKAGVIGEVKKGAEGVVIA